jgi:serine/threonine protein kinase
LNVSGDDHTRLGNYEIHERLGRGGMGIVYRAREMSLDRPVALKVLNPSAAADPHEMARFEQEARATSALNHPHIVQIFDLDSAEHEGQSLHFIAMELVDGRSLRKLMEESTPLGKLLANLVQVADALDTAHEKGIVHRDVKPENILVTADGYSKLVDFGIAKLTGSSELRARSLGTAPGNSPVTQAGEVMGTLAYMAPEQIRGDEVDGRTDVFALGNILFEAVMGEAPFRRENAAATIRSIREDDIPEIRNPRRAAPVSLERVIRRCLDKNPARRFGTARELADALRAVLEEMHAEPATWVPVEHIEFDRRAVLIGIVLVALVLVVAFLVSRT